MPKNNNLKPKKIGNLEKLFLALIVFPFFKLLNPFTWHIYEINNKLISGLLDIFSRLLILLYTPAGIIVDLIQKFTPLSEIASVAILVGIINLIALVAVGLTRKKIFWPIIFLTLFLVVLGVISNHSSQWLSKTIRESTSRRHLELGEKIKISISHCQFKEYGSTPYKNDIFKGLLECEVVFSGLPDVENIPESFAGKYNPLYRIEYSSFREKIEGLDGGYYASSVLQNVSGSTNGKATGSSRIQIKKNTNPEDLFISRFNYSDGFYEYGPKKREVPIKDYLKE